MTQQQIYEFYLPGYTDCCSDEEKQRLWQQASPHTQYQLNSQLQLELGQGADLLSFDSAERTSINPLASPNMLSMDVAYWCAQHWLSVNSSGGKTAPSIPSEYINLLCGEPMRLYYHSQFVYARFYSALHYVLLHVKSLTDHWSQERYPYQLPPSFYHGLKQAQSRSELPMRGEGYQSLRHYFLQHYSDWLDDHYFEWLVALNKQLNQQTAAAYIVESEDEEGIPRVDFICKNESALRIVRPQHFVEDIERIATSSDFLDYEVQQIVAEVEKACRIKGW